MTAFLVTRRFNGGNWPREQRRAEQKLYAPVEIKGLSPTDGISAFEQAMEEAIKDLIPEDVEDLTTVSVSEAVDGLPVGVPVAWNFWQGKRRKADTPYNGNYVRLAKLVLKVQNLHNETYDAETNQYGRSLQDIAAAECMDSTEGLIVWLLAGEGSVEYNQWLLAMVDNAAVAPDDFYADADAAPDKQEVSS